MLTKITTIVRRWFPSNEPAEFGNVQSVERFRALLERERARVDRRGGEFCLLSFHFPSHERTPSALLHLAQHLNQRLRVTDDIGWLPGGTLAALLTDTPLPGGTKVATDIGEFLSADWPAPEIRIQTYPDLQNGEVSVAPHEQQDQNPDPAGDRRIVAIHRQAAAHAGPSAMQNIFEQGLPWWKRTLDVCAAGCALVLLSPVLAIVALLVRRSSSGPIFFTQQRSGRGGRPFEIYKFRSMVVNADELKAALRAQSEQDGPAFKLKNDPRITGIGAFLRKTSLDELPQLWNVLKGDMSLVGPRPLPVDESAACQVWQRRRLDVTPGLTCIWQVRGRSRVTFDEWIRMDINYLQARTLWGDVKLILQTVPAVLLRRGAS